MESDEISDRYFTYDGRLNSFGSAQPAARRPSNAKGKALKAPAWPHKQLDPVQFARAGFYFDPSPERPDNTVCFLCLKQVGGWEADDNPFEEHLRLSPHCGWAIVAAIEVGLGDYALDDPAGSEMIEARKATFGGQWPHEGKRGWKCKTKQLVDAGWKYTPTQESDDMATCTYCQLALDGWEPKDNPMDEHYRRSPDCHFFRLISQYKQAPTKKKGRGKGARTSKASRLSAQSVATTTSDATSLLDNPANYEDSVITTTSVMTQGGTKRGRAKKGTATRGKKTKAKKDEVIEVHEDPPEVQEEQLPPPPSKPTRGRKRASDDSNLTVAELPAPKKRATRGRRSNTVENSALEQQADVEMNNDKPAPPPKTRGRGRSASARNGRKVSTASTASTASNLSVPGDMEHLLDDEELDRQLQADFDRPLSDDENIAADSDLERKKVPVKTKGKKASTKKGVKAGRDETLNDHAMFDPAPAEIDEEAVNAELKALEAEMHVEPVEMLQVPKKGRKAGTRKASKQTKKAKEQTPVEPEPQPEPTAEAAAVDELAEGHDSSVISNTTVVRTSLASSSGAPKKRGRPSKKAALATSDTKPDELADAVLETQASSKIERVDFGNPTQKSTVASQDALATHARPTSPPATSPPLETNDLKPPATPKAMISPAPAAKQATLSPSQSPQSSDAENQPPSSKPSNTTNSNRVALAPIAETPARSSPSKRNILTGLQSNQPWTAIDVELIFEDLDKENAAGSAKYLKGGADLTSPEKRMTVEEWIHHNATQGELKLKHECEAMVTAFEREGTRAMRSLEGLVVE
ncbi:hypothetical protein F4779DRAFT_574375 [Xylariaceae sp. FL0662B]|nr:hypothetical protein F4779DRAFT_574375 [Xylariaceae sp. FL0662B]